MHIVKRSLVGWFPEIDDLGKECVHIWGLVDDDGWIVGNIKDRRPLDGGRHEIDDPIGAKPVMRQGETCGKEPGPFSGASSCEINRLKWTLGKAARRTE